MGGDSGMIAMITLHGKNHHRKWGKPPVCSGSFPPHKLKKRLGRRFKAGHPERGVTTRIFGGPKICENYHGEFRNSLARYVQYCVVLTVPPYIEEEKRHIGGATRHSPPPHLRDCPAEPRARSEGVAVLPRDSRP